MDSVANMSQRELWEFIARKLIAVEQKLDAIITDDEPVCSLLSRDDLDDIFPT